MSATRLLILGALRFLQPAHGYSVRQELETWRADEWANIAYGSIYHALNKMAAEGLLEEVATAPSTESSTSRRPQRISYVVTPLGEEQFQRLLRDYWWNRKHVSDPLQLAAAFIDQLPAAEMRSVLEHRLLMAEASVAEVDHLLRAPVMEMKPAHVRDVLDLNRERIRAEVTWLRRMIDRLNSETDAEVATTGGDSDPAGPNAEVSPPPAPD